MAARATLIIACVISGVATMLLLLPDWLFLPSAQLIYTSPNAYNSIFTHTKIGVLFCSISFIFGLIGSAAGTSAFSSDTFPSKIGSLASQSHFGAATALGYLGWIAALLASVCGLLINLSANGKRTIDNVNANET